MSPHGLGFQVSVFRFQVKEFGNCEFRNLGIDWILSILKMIERSETINPKSAIQNPKSINP